MGYYIEVPRNKQKALQIMALHGAKFTIIPPKSLSELAENEGLVCVVENGPFDAAGYCYDDDELEAFNDPRDHRPKTWLTMDKKLAEKLSGYKEIREVCDESGNRLTFHSGREQPASNKLWY